MGVALTAALTLDAPSRAAALAPFQAVELRLAQLVATVPAAGVTPLPGPTPIASPSPHGTPTPHPYQRSRGRFQFSLNGSMSLGLRQSSQTLSVPGFSTSPSASPSPGTLTTNQGATQTTLGMLAEISKRSASSETDIKLPLGFASNSRLSLGQLSVFYSTSRYGLGYGPQTISAFGQLNIGTTLRGDYAVVPVRNGQVTLVNGPTIGAQSEQIPLRGMSWRQFTGRNLYELGYLSASGPETGRSQTMLVGAATSRGPVTAIGEAALQERTGGDNATRGMSYQVRVDDGSLQSYLTAIARHVAPGTVEFGAGEYYGENFWDLSLHKNTTLQNFSFDTSNQTLGSADRVSTTATRSSSLQYGGPLARFGNYTFGVTSTRTGGTDALTQWQGSANLQLSASVGRGQLFLGANTQRTTQAIDNGQTGQSGFGVSLQQALGSIFMGVGYNGIRQTSQAYGATAQASETFSISKQFRKTNIGVFQTFTHSTGVLSNALTRSTQYSVTRQISPALSLQASYVVQALNDRINPSANNHSHSLSFSINAPFAFGNGIVSGPPDPRLPATILGRVLTDTSANPSFASLMSAGVSNVQVVLDDKVVQRTDVNGNFQFSFVSPGQHQIRVETASLPRGVTVDIPVYTIKLDGGQTAQVSFLVGDFGGIQGHVYGTNEQGETVPLPNVSLRVDSGIFSQTDLTGAYGFGRLRPGKHTVTVIESTVPAFATFDSKKAKAEVDVKDGVFSKVDFSAEPLGSIAGSVVYAKDMGVDTGKGVLNVYVVAEPGEHAAIVNDDGSFIIDDLPPGAYTVSVDDETVPESLGASPDSIAVTLGPQERYQGAAFEVGHMEKKVVFSFMGSGSANAPSLPVVRVSEQRLPPRGTATVTVDAPESAKSVAVEVFDKSFALTYEAGAKVWRGTLEVPTNVKAGPYTIEAKVGNGTPPVAAHLTVDARMPLAIMHTEPANPQPGQYVRVRARFLVDVRPGDEIQWQDGQITKLGKPIAGRVFTFNLRISLRPLHGVLLTKGSRLPISLM